MSALFKQINKYYLLSTAEQNPVILYHGTSSKNLDSILSQGLLTSPKHRVWHQDLGASFKNPSRVPLSGIYVTPNLDLAIAAASNSIKNKSESKEYPIIIVVKSKPSAIMADEDDVARFLSEVKIKDSKLSEEKSLHLYINYYLGKNLDAFEESKKRYVEENYNKLERKFPHEIHASLSNRIKEILNDGFLSALKRQVIYIHPGLYDKVFTEEYLKGKPLSRSGFSDANKAAKESKLDKSQVLQEYSEYMESITIACKNIVSTTKSGRIKKDIYYSGNIKIIAIVGIPDVENFEYKV